MDKEQLLKIILERFDNVDIQFKEVISRLERIEKSQQEDVKDANIGAISPIFLSVI